MPAISRVLVQQCHLDIFGCEQRTDIDLKGWVANQNYTVDTQLSSSQFCLTSADKGYLMAALANDCNRMAMAAIETISGIQPDLGLNRSGAWGIIRSYYASFFAAHSIMRMYGISCSQLEQPHVNKIYESADITGKTGGLNRLDKGFYSIKVDKNFSQVKFNKFKDSHRDTWGEFLLLINDLIDGSANASAIGKYKVEAVSVLSKVRDGITRSRCKDKGNWLSMMRNAVNYRHEHGAWYPYGRRSKAVDYITKAHTEWMKKPTKIEAELNKGDVEVFFEVSFLINSLLRELIIACSLRQGTLNPVFQNGSIKLINQIRAA